MQLFATVLSVICDRVYGTFLGRRLSKDLDVSHYSKDLFDRRLKQGRCFRTPCRGWRELTCSVWEHFQGGISKEPKALSSGVMSLSLKS